MLGIKINFDYYNSVLVSLFLNTSLKLVALLKQALIFKDGNKQKKQIVLTLARKTMNQNTQFFILFDGWC